PTRTLTTTATPSATPTPTLGPHITIGDAGGAAGGQVAVSLSLMKNGPNIVSIVPVTLGFDTTVLTFNSCSKAAGVSAGKSLSTGTPMAGQVTVALVGDLTTIADGDFASCTFTISASATVFSTTTLHFVEADLSDDMFNDYFAS